MVAAASEVRETMGQILDFYNIIFLVLAVVVFLRLRSVLGRKTGSERPPVDPYQGRDRPEAGDRDNVIPMPPRGAPGSGPEPVGAPGEPVPEGSAIDRALRAVMAADRTFEPNHFLAGARAAYEMIVTGFAVGDRKALRPLLSKEVFDGFVAAIQDRESRGEKVETTFVGIDKAEIVEAGMRAGFVQITVRFVSQLITVTRNAQGDVIDGDPSKVSELVDIWTFERNAGSSDPNWYLVATKTPD
ncbi:Tim44/TimA family putative adaptor protein [Prosthecomicrobium hirschii]|uniref:Tim44/TimA family putative adaptor protein n=1 Tax=Prosthecodimorpha hirschii TaxID=665126 RepID=UPI000B0F13B2|nr:Tim44/TimA family putative adaptor protein [Prosthecomicrobium hirschii]MCW1842105.1 Tim44/TimA family putative adaptor protein [Prosthecomicrobium hirschii]